MASGRLGAYRIDKADIRSVRRKRMMEISKADWKLYRERVGDWQEHYMEKLVKQYIKLLSSPGNASDHFWELEKRIQRDRKHPGVIIELRKSEAIWDIAMFIQKRSSRWKTWKDSAMS